MVPGVQGQLAKRVGLAVQAARAEAQWSQRTLAERAGTSQQWISRVERGEVDLRLSRIERLLRVLDRRLVLESAGIPDTASDDPDMVDPAEAAELLTFYVSTCGILWRRLDKVPYVVAGRLAALAQGMLIRPSRVDLRVAASDVLTATAALARRRHDRNARRHRAFDRARCDRRRRRAFASCGAAR
jgi:transcriptional regulator with XRE-family HTH domain